MAEQPRYISFQIAGPARTGTARLPLAERLVIGRGSDSGENAPDLDLSPYGGAGSGVSRSHAALLSDSSYIYVEDLGSTSGTRLNGLALVARQPYRLRSGDELELGQVRLTARF